nr:papain-like [Rhipicephalus microplus]
MPQKDEEEKNYDSDSEDSDRFKVYVENMEFIQEHNEKFNKQLASHSVELNHFGDMSSANSLMGWFTHAQTEFRSRVWRLNEFEHLAGCGNVSEMEDDEYNADVNITALLGEGEIPEYVDWRERGFLTPVKSQGRCELTPDGIREKAMTSTFMTLACETHCNISGLLDCSFRCPGLLKADHQEPLV